jgi:nucleoside-diphosphate-sugar epimerase
MKILVAGGAGYIGSVLIPKLLRRGYDVTVVDLFWFKNQLPESVKTIEKDIMTMTESDLEGFDQVIFMGGLSNDPMAEYSPAKNFISNASAPAFLAYIAKRAGIKRYIYACSCSVYGYTVNELYDETSPAVSNYPYGISKLQGEQAVLQMVDEDFSVISLRQGTVCGYSPRMRLDLVVNTMYKTALTEKQITVNNPAIWRPILSVQDAASAYIRSVEAHESISGIFNVASGNYTVGELGDIVQQKIKEHLKIDIRLNVRHITDYRNYKVSIAKAEKVLSYKPRHDVESIVDELVEHQDSFQDFDNPYYYNIQVFKDLDAKNQDKAQT